MFLTKNPKWNNLAKKLFEINVIVNNGKENCLVDYALFDESQIMYCYGFDFPKNDIEVINVFNILRNEQTEKANNSLIDKMFKFYDYGNNPFVFLSSQEKLYYLPLGIRQTNSHVWESTDSLEELLEKIKNHNISH
jgi:hypothetical protein